MEEKDMEEGRVDPGEMDDKFQILQKLENRKFVYDARDEKHKNRQMVSTAWEEIATDIKMNGKQVTATWCKSEWKKLKDYYFKVKKSIKGKSGQGATKSKPWIYFYAVDRLLATCEEENYNNQSNLEESAMEQSDTGATETSSSINSTDDNSSQGSTTDEVGAPAERNQQGTSQKPGPSPPKESTPNRRGRFGVLNKRQLDEETNKKILELLKEPEEVKDDCYHLGMTVAAKLRRLPVDAQDYAMKHINDLLYDLIEQHK